MRTRLPLFVISMAVGVTLGLAWNWPGFKAAYEGLISLFVDPAAPLVASTVILLAFVSGVSRVCVP